MRWLVIAIVVGVARIAAANDGAPRAYRCGLGPTMLILIAGFGALAIISIILVIAVGRRLTYGGAFKHPAEPVSSLAVEPLVRGARRRDVLWLVVAVGMTSALAVRNELFAVLAIIWCGCRIHDLVMSQRAARMFESEHATTERRDNYLVVRLGRARAVVRLSHRAFKRARANAIPTARVQ